MLNKAKVNHILRTIMIKQTDILTIEQLAERMEISVKTIRNRLAKNAFPITGFKINGKWAFKTADWINHLENTALTKSNPSNSEISRTEIQDQVDQLQTQIDGLVIQINSQRTQMDSQQTQLTEFQAQQSEHATQINELVATTEQQSQEILALKSDLSRVTTELATPARKVEPLEQQITQAQPPQAQTSKQHMPPNNATQRNENSPQQARPKTPPNITMTHQQGKTVVQNSSQVKGGATGSQAKIPSNTNSSSSSSATPAATAASASMNRDAQKNVGLKKSPPTGTAGSKPKSENSWWWPW